MSIFLNCKKMFLFSLLVVALFTGAASLSSSAQATEGGGGAYPNGAEDSMIGALPPPGTYFLNYLTYYRATSFKDQNGNHLMPKFNLDAVANVFRLIEVTKYRIFGASWAMHAFVPIVHIDVEATPGKDHRAGLGDIIVDPFILGWHFKNFHIVTGPDIFIPTGNYNKNRLANTSRNYWTFEPVLALTYLADNGIELSGKFLYDINLKNPDTDYKSGQEFHVDYVMGYHVDKNLTLGACGYYYQQTTDDKLDGTSVEPDGFKGRVISLGPLALYNYKNMWFTLKWYKEFEVENRPEGSNLFFKFLYAF
jgi:hypothetical protein